MEAPGAPALSIRSHYEMGMTTNCVTEKATCPTVPSGRAVHPLVRMSLWAGDSSPISDLNSQVDHAVTSRALGALTASERDALVGRLSVLALPPRAKNLTFHPIRHSAAQRQELLREAAELRLLVNALASVLATAHEHGWPHRDIKPRNILYFDGRWVLADWGIVRRLRNRPPAAGPDHESGSHRPLHRHGQLRRAEAVRHTSRGHGIQRHLQHRQGHRLGHHQWAAQSPSAAAAPSRPVAHRPPRHHAPGPAASHELRSRRWRCTR